MDTHAAREQPQHDAIVCGPPIRQLFRDVIADRLRDRMPLKQRCCSTQRRIPPGTTGASSPSSTTRSCTRTPVSPPPPKASAEGLALLAALAVDDRIPARHRFQAVDLLFRAATVAERHLAETWPATPQHADPDSEARGCKAIRLHTPDLLARWPVECPAVRLAVAGLAVVFPTDRTLPALTARLHSFMNQHPQGTDIGDYVRFVLVLTAQDDSQTLAVTEKLTNSYWTGTARGVPTRARALHLLGQMLTKVGAGLTRPRAGQ